jgi:hypothetical protein
MAYDGPNKSVNKPFGGKKSARRGFFGATTGEKEQPRKLG